MSNKPLHSLVPGETGRIVSIRSSGIRQRLMDLGIVPGARIEMIRSAPLGDPLKVRVCNTLVALRKSEAKHIMVEHDERPCGRQRARRRRFGRKSKQR